MADELLTANQAHIARLEDRVRQLERELAEKDRQIAHGEAANRQAVLNLRRQLAPLYKALREVFGELDTLAGDTNVPWVEDPVLNTPYWETWKSRVSRSGARIIDVLRVTPHLNNTQIAAAAKMDKGTVSNTLVVLRKLGILATGPDNKHSLQVPGGA